MPKASRPIALEKETPYEIKVLFGDVEITGV